LFIALSFFGGALLAVPGGSDHHIKQYCV
jgi:hypothetical protein